MQLQECGPRCEPSGTAPESDSVCNRTQQQDSLINHQVKALHHDNLRLQILLKQERAANQKLQNQYHALLQSCGYGTVGTNWWVTTVLGGFCYTQQTLGVLR